MTVAEINETSSTIPESYLDIDLWPCTQEPSSVIFDEINETPPHELTIEHPAVVSAADICAGCTIKGFCRGQNSLWQNGQTTRVYISAPIVSGGQLLLQNKNRREILDVDEVTIPREDIRDLHDASSKRNLSNEGWAAYSFVVFGDTAGLVGMDIDKLKADIRANSEKQKRKTLEKERLLGDGLRRVLDRPGYGRDVELSKRFELFAAYMRSGHSFDDFFDLQSLLDDAASLMKPGTYDTVVRESGECGTTETLVELFSDSGSDPTARVIAQAVCANCKVQDECLLNFLQGRKKNPIVTAGLTEDDQAYLIRALRRSLPSSLSAIEFDRPLLERVRTLAEQILYPLFKEHVDQFYGNRLIPSAWLQGRKPIKRRNDEEVDTITPYRAAFKTVILTALGNRPLPKTDEGGL
ncbi:WhiB family transcriptional regulator [Candidatus Saccharibacteria bacterium]|nr:WhiB family transcriptional regulator [Candidatus Saccharibacteria bacterium]MCA9328346.1 WhiB family transcriptional regulator [Candidatus Saccharibacteria bacterium]